MPWKSKTHDPLKSLRRSIRRAKGREEYRYDELGWMYLLPEWRDKRIGIRAQRLALEPLCRHCAAEGRTVAAQAVDHIRPHRGDMLLFIDLSNTQSLCHSCHSKKTVKDRSKNDDD